MRKIFSLILGLFAVLFCFTGCDKKEPLVVKQSDTYIAIFASDEQMELTNNTTLVEYMTSLKQDGELVFEMENGMVTSINGIANPSDWSSCWMLYTSDTDNANMAWGSIEYNGNFYGSASQGAELLKVKDGCYYIWIFQSLN